MSEVTMDPVLVWAIILAIGAGTLVARLSFIVLLGRLSEIPPQVKRLLALVPPAALAALVAPSLLVADGTIAIGLGNDRLFAGAAAAVVAWRSGNLLATVVAGLAVFWLLTLVP